MSTSNPAARKYHHGDLRQALLGEALRLVEAGGADALSLRELARSLGVSATALYRHFPDKRALMTAVAAEGLERLHQAQEEASAREREFTAAFTATGRAYVRFALDHPQLFRLIFTYPGLVLPNPTQDDAASSLHALALRAAGGRENAARIVAVQAWSLVHGLAMLMLDGRLPRDEALIDHAIRGAAIGADSTC